MSRQSRVRLPETWISGQLDSGAMMAVAQEQGNWNTVQYLVLPTLAQLAGAVVTYGVLALSSATGWSAAIPVLVAMVLNQWVISFTAEQDRDEAQKGQFALGSFTGLLATLVRLAAPGWHGYVPFLLVVAVSALLMAVGFNRHRRASRAR